MLPLALTIFGFSMSSPESERFSEAGAVAAAGCSFFCLAAFLAGLAGASAFAATGFSPSRESIGAGADFGSLVFGSSGLGLVGCSGSAILLINQLNFAGFGFRIANHADGLARALACPGICRSALPAHRQAFAVPDTAITVDCLQTFQVTLDLATQITFDLDLVVRDRVNDFVQLLRCEIFRAQIRVDVGLLENTPGRVKPDSVNICERRFDAFVRWNFNSE